LKSCAFRHNSFVTSQYITKLRQGQSFFDEKKRKSAGTRTHLFYWRIAGIFARAANVSKKKTFEKDGDGDVRCAAWSARKNFGALPRFADAPRPHAQAEIRAKTVTAADHKATTRCRIRTKDGRLQLVRAITRLKSSPYHGAVYYAVIVEEEGG